MEDQKEQREEKRQEQKQIREAVERAYALTAEDLDWRPYYPNNMPQNGQEGWYCVIQDGDHARKYTIKFQYPLVDGASRPDLGVDRYILFQKLYHGLEGPLEYPGPAPDFDIFHSPCDINSFGDFVYAHKTLEDAKRQVVWQWQAVFGYALSHLLEPEEDEL